MKPSQSRRRFLALAGATALFAHGVPGCQRRESLLRVAAHPWPGYELLQLARAENYFDDGTIRLVESQSATASLHILAANRVEAACLTLDEVLTARAEGIDLVVAGVFDESLGADVLLAKPALTSLQQLKGRRIGVEQTALGAVMLHAMLRRAGLHAADVHIVRLTVDEHQAAYARDAVDALITFEPVISQLRRQGARVLFSSAEIPGLIVDVLAVQRRALATHAEALRALLAGHFRARDAYLAQPDHFAAFIANRLQLDVTQLPAVFAGIRLSDIAQNHAWFAGATPRLATQAATLETLMRGAGLLPRPVPLANLVDARFLPSVSA